MSMVSQMRRFAKRPSYLFGRFATVRRAYAAAQAVLRPRDGVLHCCLAQSEEGVPLVRAVSGMVESDRSAAEHVRNLRRTAWSDGIRLTPAALEALRGYAHAARVRFQWGADQTGAADSVADLTPGHRAQIADRHRQADPGLALPRNPAPRRRFRADRRHNRPFRLSTQPRNPPFPLELRQPAPRSRPNRDDVEGLNFAYVNFYLSPTDRTTGAHVLIDGSHRRKKLAHLLATARIGDAEAEALYGRERIVTIERAAGEGFFEDTSCFHKALAPVAGDRLLLQLRYL
jgi:hypothetical protein